MSSAINKINLNFEADDRSVIHFQFSGRLVHENVSQKGNSSIKLPFTFLFLFFFVITHSR